MQMREAYRRVIESGVDWDSLTPAQQWGALFKVEEEQEMADVATQRDAESSTQG